MSITDEAVIKVTDETVIWILVIGVTRITVG